MTSTISKKITCYCGSTFKTNENTLEFATNDPVLGKRVEEHICLECGEGFQVTKKISK